MKSKLELTARGRVTLLLAHMTASAAIVTGGDPTAKLATAALAAPFLIDLLYKLLLPPEIAARIARRRTRAGDLFLEDIELRNASPRVHAHSLELDEPATSVRQGTAYIETLPAGTTASVRMPARVRRRGVTLERAIQIMTRHPFGMVQRRFQVECTTELVAEPPRTNLRPEVLTHLLAKDKEPQAVGATAGNEFFALREYHPGDDARHVHARRSASLATLVAKDLRGGHNPDAAIVVDLRRTPGRGFHFGDRTIEPRLSLAATLLDELLLRQIRPLCIVIGVQLEKFTVDTQADAEEFLNELAIARAVPFWQLGTDAFDELPPGCTSFWVPAGGHDARRDRQRLDDVMLLEEKQS